MHIVIFEVTPKAERYDEYLSIAASLRSELEKIDGFISVERFSSLTDEGKLLSLSTWRDEEAVIAWRENMQHNAAQNRGRQDIFASYRIRVATVIRDYGIAERDEAPQE